MSKIIKLILTNFWQIFFKVTLVPLYKFFLSINKYLQKYLIKNPHLTSQQNKINSRQNFAAHIIITFIVVFVLAANFTTRETYAGEFNKKSIIAQLFISDIEEEIIEKSPAIETIKEKPKTETILSQLNTLESKKNTIINKPSKMEEAAGDGRQIALSQGGEALIKPGLTPLAGKEKNQNDSNLPIKKEIQYYTVQSGDTLSAIAKKFGISINTILWENNLSLNSYIRPGDKLAILPVTGVTYAVRSGDTLSAIAKKLGTTVDKILASNNLSSPSVIKARQKLIIPGGKLGAYSPSRTKNIYSKSSSSPSAQNFLWPTSSKRITQYYHWRHHAIDIGGKTGNPIYASQAGRVERAGWSRGYGYNIVINHGSGVKTLYAHASRLYVKHGQQVSQGEAIGAVGSTGWSTGPHVHFEIIINGRKVNPLSYL